MIIRWLYTVFLAVILVTFVGVGIAAFYKAPKSPEYPVGLSYPSVPNEKSSDSGQMRDQQIKFDKEQRNFQKSNETYNKSVSSLAITASLIILILSITLLSKILYLSDGLLLGGVLTLGYAIIRGFGSGDEMFRFIIVSVGLIVAVFLGYWKFVKTIKIKQ